MFPPHPPGFPPQQAEINAFKCCLYKSFFFFPPKFCYEILLVFMRVVGTKAVFEQMKCFYSL